MSTKWKIGLAVMVLFLVLGGIVSRQDATTVEPSTAPETEEAQPLSEPEAVPDEAPDAVEETTEPEAVQETPEPETPDEQEVSETEEIPTEETENEPEETSEVSLDALVETFKTVLSSSYEDNFSVDVETIGSMTLVTVNTWKSGVVLEAALAKSGDAEMKSYWDTMKEQYKESSVVFQDFFTKLGRKDVMVDLTLRNDMNKDNILLEVSNGVVLADAVTG